MKGAKIKLSYKDAFDALNAMSSVKNRIKKSYLLFVIEEAECNGSSIYDHYVKYITTYNKEATKIQRKHAVKIDGKFDITVTIGKDDKPVETYNYTEDARNTMDGELEKLLNETKIECITYIIPYTEVEPLKLKEWELKALNKILFHMPKVESEWIKYEESLNKSQEIIDPIAN